MRNVTGSGARLLRSLLLCFVTVVTFLALALGCGGGGNDEAAETGSTRIVIVWPKESRLIPIACKSITITYRDGRKEVGKTPRVVARPASGETTLTFTKLPAKTLTLSAIAYPNADGTGVAQASGSMSVTIVRDETRTDTLTMGSTIDRIEVAPTPLDLKVGESKVLVASPRDSEGRLVLTSSTKTQWSSSNTASATVDGTGRVTAIAPGSAEITFTDAESAKSGKATITVASLPNPAVQIGRLETLQDRIGFNTWMRGWENPGPNVEARLSAIRPFSPRFMRVAILPDNVSHWDASTKTLTYYDAKWNVAMAEIDAIFRAKSVPIIVLQTHHWEMKDSTFGKTEPIWPFDAGWATEDATQAALASMAARLAKQLALQNPQSDFFIEVGNELNKNPQWRTKRESYADLLFKVVDAVGPVAPRAVVMPTAFTFLESGLQPNPPSEQLPVESLRWLSSQSEYSKLKAVALHVYNSVEDRPDENGVIDKGRAAPPEDLLRHLREARSLAGGRRLVVTETGKSLTYNPEVPTEEGPAGNFLQRSQSNYTLRYLLTCLQAGADIIVLYELSDRTFGQNEEENNFGLLDRNLQMKTAGSAVLELFGRVGAAKALTWKRQAEVLRDTPPHQRYLYEYRFQQPDGSSTYVRWTDRIHFGTYWPENTEFPRRPTSYSTSLLH